MRGTLYRPHPSWCGSRIIPAYAGNALPASISRKSPSDHPRVCGERGSLAMTSISACWIIPAYAGNATSLSGFPAVSTDHPRVCGERVLSSKRVERISGSSPRMRGTPSLPACEVPRMRIIPAYAGNARRHQWYPWKTPDHPRVCGERVVSMVLLFPWHGSSPRMRGTLLLP